MSSRKTYNLSIDKGVSDWIKFLSALMVAFHHYSQYALCSLHESGIVFKIFSSVGGYLGVAIFFFFSGYGLMESEQKRHLSFLKFIQKRFSKIYLPVLLVTLLWIGSCHIFDINHQSGDIQLFTGGGNLNEIFFGFYDGVLWFVKVLIVIYLAFYAFSALRPINETFAWLLFVILTIVIQVCTNYYIASYAILSIPFFTIGVFASEFKDRCFGGFNVSMLPLVVYPAIAIMLNIHIVVVINSIVIITLISICTRWDIKVTCPTILSTLAFDIYLVHNKILMMGRTYTDVFHIWEFVLFTIIAALSFYFIRMLVLQPKEVFPFFRKVRSNIF